MERNPDDDDDGSLRRFNVQQLARQIYSHTKLSVLWFSCEFRRHLALYLEEANDSDGEIYMRRTLHFLLNFLPNIVRYHRLSTLCNYFSSEPRDSKRDRVAKVSNDGEREREREAKKERRKGRKKGRKGIDENVIERLWKRTFVPSCPWLVSRYTGITGVRRKRVAATSTFYLPIELVTHRAWEPREPCNKTREKEATSDVSATQSIRANNHNDDSLSLSLSLVVICRLLFPASLTRLSPRRNGYILSAEIFRKLDRCFLAEAVPCAGYVTMGATLPTSLIQRYNTMNRPDTLAYGYTQCLVHSSDATSCTLPTLENWCLPGEISWRTVS